MDKSNIVFVTVTTIGVNSDTRFLPVFGLDYVTDFPVLLLTQVPVIAT